MPKTKKVLITILMAVVCMSAMVPLYAVEAEAQVANDSGVTRIYGDNYYANSLNVAYQLRLERGGAKFNSMILVSGSSYQNALSATYLAQVTGAPIIFARTRALSDIVDFANKNLNASGTVYIIGDTTEISGKFDRRLKRSFKIDRISGGGKRSVNLKVIEKADQISKSRGKSLDRNVMVCPMSSYYEGMVAAATGHPVLLVGDKLSAAQKKFLQNRGRNRFYIIGGTNAVSNSVMNAVNTIGRSTYRYYGGNAYETATMVAKKFFGSKSREAVLVNANNYYEGIMAAPLAQAKKCPILLNSPAKPAYAYNYEIKYGTTHTTIIGKTSAVETKSAATAKRLHGGWNTYNDRYVYITSSGRMAVNSISEAGYTVTPTKGGMFDVSGNSVVRRRQDSSAYGTAIVIHISSQKLDFARNGDVVFTTDIVTGRSGKYDTPVGIYKVDAKVRNVNLVGPDWDSFVNYWMPFLRGYYGIHDATWRSSFGGSIYKWNGSHGCVNLPYSKMVQLWGMVSVGTKVVVKYS